VTSGTQNTPASLSSILTPAWQLGPSDRTAWMAAGRSNRVRQGQKVACPACAEFGEGFLLLQRKG
jgi:hypothetical protein